MVGWLPKYLAPPRLVMAHLGQYAPLQSVVANGACRQGAPLLTLCEVVPSQRGGTRTVMAHLAGMRHYLVMAHGYEMRYCCGIRPGPTPALTSLWRISQKCAISYPCGLWRTTKKCTIAKSGERGWSSTHILVAHFLSDAPLDENILMAHFLLVRH